LPPKRPHPAQATYTLKTSLRQEAFLAMFPKCGTISGTAKALGITPDSAHSWIKTNHLGFRDRMVEARQRFGEFLEDMALQRVMNPSFNGKIGSDLLLIALLNANMPAKYRANQPVPDDTAKEILQELRKRLGGVTVKATRTIEEVEASVEGDSLPSFTEVSEGRLPLGAGDARERVWGSTSSPRTDV